MSGETLPRTFSAFGTYSTDGVVITVSLTGNGSLTTTVAAGAWAVTFTNANPGNSLTLRAVAGSGPATADNLTITGTPPINDIGGGPESG